MSTEFENRPECNEAAAKPGSARGFTVVETLMVLGGIVLLILMLLPLSRGGVREAAREVNASTT